MLMRDNQQVLSCHYNSSGNLILNKNYITFLFEKYIFCMKRTQYTIFHIPVVFIHNSLICRQFFNQFSQVFYSERQFRSRPRPQPKERCTLATITARATLTTAGHLQWHGGSAACGTHVIMHSCNSNVNTLRKLTVRYRIYR